MKTADIVATPEEFIKTIRESNPQLEYECLHGGCFQFFELLSKVYPDAVPYINDERDHVVTKIGNNLYDITGYVGNPLGKAGMKYHKMDDSELRAAAKWGSEDIKLILDSILSHL